MTRRCDIWVPIWLNTVTNWSAAVILKYMLGDVAQGFKSDSDPLHDQDCIDRDASRLGVGASRWHAGIDLGLLVIPAVFRVVAVGQSYGWL